MASRARNRIDKDLKDMERRIAQVYADSPTLRHIKKELDDYMADVWKQVKPLHRAIVDKETKQAYIDAVQDLTLRNKKYKSIVKKFVAGLAKVNSSALEITNSQMRSMYALGYNEVADDLRRVGVKVGRRDF